MEKWKTDYPLNQEPDQLKRIESARKANMTPLWVDKEKEEAEFMGSTSYIVSLEKCPCNDFMRRKKPCKHMYRLAMKLGLMEVDYKSDKTKIRTPSAERIALSDVVEALEEMDEEAIEMLQVIMRNIRTNTDYEYNDTIGRLAKAGFIVVNGTQVNGNIVHIGITTKLEGSYKKFYTYLLRRNSTEAYYDIESGEFIEIPYGARFTYHCKLDGTRSAGRWEFPQDDITFLLDKYNKNRCK